MKDLIRKIVKESLEDDAPQLQSNLDRLMDQFQTQFPSEFKSKVPVIGNFVSDYIRTNNINIKFLNSCFAGFASLKLGYR